MLIQFAGATLKSVRFSAAQVKRFDCVVIATAHKAIDYSALLRWSKTVVDTRNALVGKRSRCVKFGEEPVVVTSVFSNPFRLRTAACTCPAVALYGSIAVLNVRPAAPNVVIPIE